MTRSGHLPEPKRWRARLRKATDVRRDDQLRATTDRRRSSRRGCSTGQLEKGIGAERSTTERLLLSIGARKAEGAEEWTLNPLSFPKISSGRDSRREVESSHHSGRCFGPN